MLSMGSTQEDRKMSIHDSKIVDKDIKHQHKQINIICFGFFSSSIMIQSSRYGIDLKFKEN